MQTTPKAEGQPSEILETLLDTDMDTAMTTARTLEPGAVPVDQTRDLEPIPGALCGIPGSTSLCLRLAPRITLCCILAVNLCDGIG